MRRTLGFAACALFLAGTGATGCGDGGGNSPNDSPQSNAGTGGGAGGTSGGSGKSDGGSGKNGGGPGASEPVKGETEFVSADNGGGSANGGRGGSADAGVSAADGAGNPSDQRTVERGDIYRVLDDQRVLNLNSYRGLQVIDIHDLRAPRIEGRLALTGTPVEMYVIGDRALVLLDDWSGYYGARDDIAAVERRNGGLVASVDISDRAHPKLLAQAIVPGMIRTSRLTQGDGKAALYVASNGYYDQTDGTNHTFVKSFDVSGESLAEKSELDLGGYVADIQATVDVLLVAARDWNLDSQRSTVTVIDISRPDGTMVQGGTITTAGVVESKFNMDAYQGVLRIVSGITWTGPRENHLETFDMHDLKQLTPIDHCTFGSDEMLEATLFMQDRAFFVTYLRTDPFHSFSIDAEGACKEHNEFVVSGWNDFLVPTLDDTRILGVGTNTDGNARMASVSLYDATNVDNPTPLLARADVDATDYNYSEAQWDDRAFSVIEDAVSVEAKDGTVEHGLVLLPFQGWDAEGERYVAQVQLLTFSDHTLTARGVMDHGSVVRRSFPTDDATTANLSEEQLSLFDTTNPNQPQELGRVEVAPNYSQLFVYGDYVARVTNRSTYFSWRSSAMSVEPPKSRVDILPRAQDLELTAPVAHFEVGADAALIQVGKLLVGVAIESVGVDPDDDQRIIYQSAIDVIDLSDPLHPQARGSLETDRLRPGYDYYGYDLPVSDCFECGRGGYYGGYYGYGGSDHHVVGKAVAFPQRTNQQKSLGIVHSCYSYIDQPPCTTASDGTTTCPEPYYAGGINCSTPKGGEETCTGAFYACNMSSGECSVVDKPKDARESCSDYEQFRYWESYSIETLDLADPDAPKMAPSVEFATDEEGVSVTGDGARLYFNFQKPHEVSGDPHPYVKRYFRTVDFGDVQHPAVSDAINVPGEVIANDGDTIYTRDIVWDDEETRTLVARLTLSGAQAHLQTSRLFHDRSVQAVRLDGAGHVLVSSDPTWSYARSTTDQQHTLTILDASSLKTTGEVAVDNWATFADAKDGRALYQVEHGLLVFDVHDAAHPKAQAYFPTLTWPSDLFFDGSEILFAGGPYGVYRFDADTYNLLQK